MDIDERKSSANEVWKWAIVAIYVEPENKYYWPNFKVLDREIRNKLLIIKRGAKTSRIGSEKLMPSTPRKSRKSKLLNL